MKQRWQFGAWILLIGWAWTGCGASGTPAFHPEASDIVFMSNRDGNGEVFLRAAGSADWKNLTNHSAGDNWPEWSPEGDRLVYQSNRNGKLDVFLLELESGVVVQLTSDADHDYLPAWTPDGRISFTSWRQGEGDPERVPHLYLVSADGTGEHRLELESGRPASGGRWSPDGKTIVFSRSDEGQPADVWLASSEGTGERRLTHDDYHNGDPVFSPDGEWIAFYADKDGRSSLVAIRPDGSDRREVLSGGQHWYPRWSPDGLWLLSCSAVEGENLDILAVPLDGSSPPITIVSGPARECEGRWRPGAP